MKSICFSIFKYIFWKYFYSYLHLPIFFESISIWIYFCSQKSSNMHPWTQTKSTTCPGPRACTGPTWTPRPRMPRAMPTMTSSYCPYQFPVRLRTRPPQPHLARPRSPQTPRTWTRVYKTKYFHLVNLHQQLPMWI